MNDTITTWRSLTGLTKAQAERLAEREELLLGDGRPAEQVHEFLYGDGQRHVERNQVDRERFGHLPDPAGATHLWHWERNEDTGRWSREVEFSSRKFGALHIDVLGTQLEDGTVTHRLTVDAGDVLTFNPAGAQALGDGMAAAVAELDRLTGDAPPFM
jgi:hypothetical protein